MNRTLSERHLHLLKKNAILNILIIAFALIFCISAGGFTYTLLKARSERRTFDRLAELYHEAETDEKAETVEGAASSDSEDEETGTKYTDRFLALEKENSDFCFWLTVPETVIDYPVMSNAGDSEYYLHRDFYKEKTYSGTPFLGKGCDADSSSIIIYGHNMKSGSMFAQLDSFRNKGFWAENNEVIIGTDTEDRVYTVFGAFETRISSSEFKYYDYVGELAEADFKELIDYIKDMSSYDTGLTPEYGDKLVMLSTCSYHAKNGRYVVAAYMDKTKNED